MLPPSSHLDRTPDIGQLTFLRFVAALGVLIFHDGREVPWLQWGLPLWNVSNTAVSFFFFLSGFVLTHVYQERPTIRVRNFYVARLARIAPVYWAALVAVSLLAWKNGELLASDELLSITLLQAWLPGHSQVLNGPGWSLSVEVFFYLLFPFLLPRVKKLRTAKGLLLAFALVWALNLAVHALAVQSSSSTTPRLTDAVYYHPVGHLGTFLLGMIGGRLLQQLPAQLTSWAPAAMLSSLGAFLIVVFGEADLLAYHHNGLFTPLFAVFVLAFASVPNSLLGRLFSSTPCIRLGEISYGMYILQDPLSSVFQAVVTRLGAPLEEGLLFPSYVAVLAATAYISFRWFEEPSRRWVRNRLSLR